MHLEIMAAWKSNIAIMSFLNLLGWQLPFEKDSSAQSTTNRVLNSLTTKKQET